MSSVVDFTTRRPIGQRTPIRPRFSLTEPPRNRVHRLDLVSVLAVLHPEDARRIRPLAAKLRSQTEKARRPVALFGGRVARGSALPRIYFARETEDDSGATVLEATIARYLVPELVAALQSAGAFEYEPPVEAVG
jgi:hypothetical protein